MKSGRWNKISPYTCCYFLRTHFFSRYSIEVFEFRPLFSVCTWIRDHSQIKSSSSGCTFIKNTLLAISLLVKSDAEPKRGSQWGYSTNTTSALVSYRCINLETIWHCQNWENDYIHDYIYSYLFHLPLLVTKRCLKSYWCRPKRYFWHCRRGRV